MGRGLSSRVSGGQQVTRVRVPPERVPSSSLDCSITLVGGSAPRKGR